MHLTDAKDCTLVCHRLRGHRALLRRPLLQQLSAYHSNSGFDDNTEGDGFPIEIYWRRHRNELKISLRKGDFRCWKIQRLTSCLFWKLFKICSEKVLLYYYLNILSFLRQSNGAGILSMTMDTILIQQIKKRRNLRYVQPIQLSYVNLCMLPLGYVLLHLRYMSMWLR